MTSVLVYAALAGAVAVVNAAYGRLRAPAPRRSHAWFGCLAAPVMLLIALRKLFAFSWAGWVGLVAAAVLGQVIGWQLGARDALPSPVRWRLAVYAGLLGALLILTGGAPLLRRDLIDLVRARLAEGGLLWTDEAEQRLARGPRVRAADGARQRRAPRAGAGLPQNNVRGDG